MKCFLDSREAVDVIHTPVNRWPSSPYRGVWIQGVERGRERDELEIGREVFGL